MRNWQNCKFLHSVQSSVLIQEPAASKGLKVERYSHALQASMECIMENAVSEPDIFESSTCDFNISTLDQMKKVENSA